MWQQFVFSQVLFGDAGIACMHVLYMGVLVCPSSRLLLVALQAERHILAYESEKISHLGCILLTCSIFIESLPSVLILKMAK